MNKTQKEKYSDEQGPKPYGPLVPGTGYRQLGRNYGLQVTSHVKVVTMAPLLTHKQRLTQFCPPEVAPSLKETACPRQAAAAEVPVQDHYQGLAPYKQAEVEIDHSGMREPKLRH